MDRTVISMGLLLLASGCGSTKSHDSSADAAVTDAADGGGGTSVSTVSTEAGQSDAPSGSCSIGADSYDQSCTLDSDCIAIVDVSCNGCRCGAGAINIHDVSQYRRDFAALVVSPSPDSGVAGACSCTCAALKPTCCRGMCTNACGC